MSWPLCSRSAGLMRSPGAGAHSPQRLGFSKCLFRLVAALACVMAPEVAAACSCALAPMPTCRFRPDSAIFVGSVEKVERVGSGGRVDYTFRVEEAFAGVNAKAIVVTSDTSSCGVSFAVGRSYLVDGRTYKGHYQVTACSNTSRAEDAGVEIQLLRQLRKGTMRPWIYGELIELKEPGPDDTPDAPHLRPPLGGVRVTAAGPGAPLVTFTDQRGQFTFRDVPPGTYRVVAHVPPPLSAEGSGPGFHRGMGDPEAVEIIECPVRLFFLASKGAPRP